MPTTVTIPEEIVRAFPEKEQAADHRVIESVVLQLYREGQISAGKVANLLGIYRGEADQLLAQNGLLNELNVEDVQREKSTLDAIFGR